MLDLKAAAVVGAEIKAAAVAGMVTLVGMAGAWVAQQTGLTREDLLAFVLWALVALIGCAIAVIGWVLRQWHKELRTLLVVTLPDIGNDLTELRAEVRAITEWMNLRKAEHAEANREMRRRAEEIEDELRRRELRRRNQPE